jgi:hypothetical protein
MPEKRLLRQSFGSLTKRKSLFLNLKVTQIGGFVHLFNRAKKEPRVGIHSFSYYFLTKVPQRDTRLN